MVVVHAPLVENDPRLGEAQGVLPVEPLVSAPAIAISDVSVFRGTGLLDGELPHSATSLRNLAGLYQRQGQCAESEPLYKRPLARYGKALGPDNPAMARTLERLAVLNRETGREAQAAKLEEQAAAMRAERR